MSILQASRPPVVPKSSHPGKYPWWRSLVLFLLLLLSLALYGALISVAPQSDAEIPSFLQVWIICFLPYLAACAFILATQPATGRWRWIELGIILVDARVTLHGYSPYVYPPEDKVFSSLHDQVIYANSRYRDSPTLYPPGAQAVFLVSYLLSPSNLYFLKGILIGFEMVTCGALALLLIYKGL